MDQDMSVLDTIRRLAGLASLSLGRGETPEGLTALTQFRKRATKASVRVDPEDFQQAAIKIDTCAIIGNDLAVIVSVMTGTKAREIGDMIEFSGYRVCVTEAVRIYIETTAIATRAAGYAAMGALVGSLGPEAIEAGSAMEKAGGGAASEPSAVLGPATIFDEPTLKDQTVLTAAIKSAPLIGRWEGVSE